MTSGPPIPARHASELLRRPARPPRRRSPGQLRRTRAWAPRRDVPGPLLRASIRQRDSSPPDATRARGRGSSPSFKRNSNPTSSAPTACDCAPGHEPHRQSARLGNPSAGSSSVAVSPPRRPPPAAALGGEGAARTDEVRAAASSRLALARPGRSKSAVSNRSRPARRRIARGQDMPGGRGRISPSSRAREVASGFHDRERGRWIRVSIAAPYVAARSARARPSWQTRCPGAPARPRLRRVEAA